MEKKSDRKTGFVFNSLSGLVQFLLTAILVFICIPIFIRNLGNVGFGVFSTVAIIGNLAHFANLSLDSALVKFLAEQGKTKESNYDIFVALLIILVLLVPLSLIAYIFKDFVLLKLLNIPPEFISDASVLLGYLLVANTLLLVGRIFTSVLDSLQRVYLNNATLLIYNLFYWGGMILVVSAGYGLKEIGAAVLIATVVWLMLTGFFALREWGSFDITGVRVNFRRIMKKQLSYSLKIYTGGLLGMLFEPLTKMLIANFAGGVVAVGFYEIGLRVKGQMSTLFLKLIYPLFPIIAREKDRLKIGGLVNKMTYRLFFIISPVIILLVFCAKPFVSMWIGYEDATDPMIMSVIVLPSVSLLFSLTVTPIYFFLRVKNHAEKEIYIQGINLVVNTICIIIFYRSLGYYSVLLGNGMALFASFLLCVYYQGKYLNFKLFNPKWLGKFIIFVLTMLAASLIISQMVADRQILYLAIQSVAVLGSGVLVAYLLKILTRENINVIK